jgi:hypothetical protein
MGRRPKPKETTIGTPFKEDGLLGLDPKEIKDHDFFNSLPPDQQKAIVEGKKKLLAEKEKVMSEEPVVPLPPKQFMAKKVEENKKPIVEKNIEAEFEVVERQLEAKAQTITPDSDDLLETSLSQSFEQENQIKAVAKELFSSSNIELKTEVNHDEINNVTRLQFLKEKFNIANVDVLVNNFLKLRVSKDRKSRAEFIEALQSDNRNQNSPNFMQKLFGGGGNNNNP